MHRNQEMNPAGQSKNRCNARSFGHIFALSCTDTCMFQFARLYPALFCFIKKRVGQIAPTNKIGSLGPRCSLCPYILWSHPIPETGTWLVGHKMANAPVKPKVTCIKGSRSRSASTLSCATSYIIRPAACMLTLRNRSGINGSDMAGEQSTFQFRTFHM